MPIFKKSLLVGESMLDAQIVEALAQSFCGISAVLFTFIASFSRSPKAENMAQNVIFVTLLLAAICLWMIPSVNGVLWGSAYLPRPLALFCIVLALAARMNIKGKNISFGANPHKISRVKEVEQRRELTEQE